MTISDVEGCINYIAYFSGLSILRVILYWYDLGHTGFVRTPFYMVQSSEGLDTSRNIIFCQARDRKARVCVVMETGQRYAAV